MIESFPLYWPEGRLRIPLHRRKDGKFQLNFAQSRDNLLREIARLGGKRVILSTNIPLRQDGLPYANTREPEDPGVAVYFDYKSKPMCFACDQYRKTRENIRGIALTIAAIRTIERHGSSDMMERAFRGFTAIPEQAGEAWRSVFGFSAAETVTADRLDAAFRSLALSEHPDHGGTSERFQRILNARNDARRAIGATA